MQRRQFLKAMLATAGGRLVLAKDPQRPTASPAADAADRFLLSATGCSRATGYAEANKIITWQGRTHVAWLDSVPEGFRVRVRSLDRANRTWSPTYTIGEAHDNHGGPALTIDSKGYLHVAYGPHGGEPMRFRTSLKPNDASSWSEETRVGHNCTYPTMVCSADDSLLLTCRERTDKLWGVGVYSKPPNEGWKSRGTLIRASTPGYAHFQEALAWGPDHRTLHLSTRIYDGKPGRGHTIGYLRTHDFGRTWARADGTLVELPATAETVTNVVNARDEKTPELRCGSIGVDTAGQVHLLYSRRQDDVLGAWLAVLDRSSGAWRHRPLLPYVEAHWPGRSLTMPGGITLGADGRVDIVLTMANAESTDAGTVWGHPTCEICRLESNDQGRHFRARLASPVDPTMPHWLPNIERPTGHNRVGQPGIIYTAGTRGSDNREIVSNEVYWTA